MIPNYLIYNLTEVKEKKEKTTAIISSSAGNTNLEIYYYGELINMKGTPFITDGEFPCLIIAKDSNTNEVFVLFDGMKHGYDSMFCNECVENARRSLVKYEKYSGKIQIRLGYSIDYEEEKNEYEFTEDGKVKLMYGDIDWEIAKSIGFDWISLKFIDTKKEFFEMELS